MKKDYIAHAICLNCEVRAYACDTTQLVAEAKRIHNLSNTATAALGRFLTAGVLMAQTMKDDKELLTLQIRSEGPLKGMTVTASTTDAETTVKGYAINPSADLPLREKDGKLDVSGIVGPGTLFVIRDEGLKQPFVGQTQLVSGEIAEDITDYFANSEQIPSSTALGVLLDSEGNVKCAGGFLIQLLPFTSDETIDKLEKALKELPPVTKMMSEGKTPEDWFDILFGDDYGLTQWRDAKYFCNCTRERVEKAIISIEEKDIDEMIADKKPIEVCCQFCDRKYSFSTEDLIRIKKTRRGKTHDPEM